MNFYGLYQAVRSRLHFSQVAAWWSRSNGADPTYITTRVVPHNEENVRKFQDSPVEHTFPLAGSGDGNSIKVKRKAARQIVAAASKHPFTTNSGTLSSIDKSMPDQTFHRCHLISNTGLASYICAMKTAVNFIGIKACESVSS